MRGKRTIYSPLAVTSVTMPFHERHRLQVIAGKLKRRGDYSQADVIRLALHRLDRWVRNAGYRRLEAEIDSMKGGPLGKGKSISGTRLDSPSEEEPGSVVCDSGSTYLEGERC